MSFAVQTIDKDGRHTFIAVCLDGRHWVVRMAYAKHKSSDYLNEQLYDKNFSGERNAEAYARAIVNGRAKDYDANVSWSSDNPGAWTDPGKTQAWEVPTWWLLVAAVHMKAPAAPVVTAQAVTTAKEQLSQVEQIVSAKDPKDKLAALKQRMKNAKPRSSALANAKATTKAEEPKPERKEDDDAPRSWISFNRKP